MGGMLPASDPGYPLAGGMTPMHELMEPLPSGVWVYASKGDNSGEDAAWIVGRPGYRIVPRRRGNMAPSTLVETFALQRYRGRVETVKSQLAAWGVQRLHARTYEGWPCTLLASLFALLCVNADEQSGDMSRGGWHARAISHRPRLPSFHR